MKGLTKNHARLNNEFTEDEKCHNLVSWLIFCQSYINEPCHDIMVFFILRKRVCAAIQWGWLSDFWSDLSSTSILYVCELRRFL